jgi:hypothetical protein
VKSHKYTCPSPEWRVGISRFQQRFSRDKNTLLWQNTLCNPQYTWEIPRGIFRYSPLVISHWGSIIMVLMRFKLRKHKASEGNSIRDCRDVESENGIPFDVTLHYFFYNLLEFSTPMSQKVTNFWSLIVELSLQVMLQLGSAWIPRLRLGFLRFGLGKMSSPASGKSRIFLTHLACLSDR